MNWQWSFSAVSFKWFKTTGIDLGVGFTLPPAGHLKLMLLSGAGHFEQWATLVCEKAVLYWRKIHLAWVVVSIALDLVSRNLGRGMEVVKQEPSFTTSCMGDQLLKSSKVPSSITGDALLPSPWLPRSNTLATSSPGQVLWDLSYLKWESTFKTIRHYKKYTLVRIMDEINSMR